MNIRELLKDCNPGTELFSPMCGKCTLEFILPESEVWCIVTKDVDGKRRTFDAQGRYVICSAGECVLFPSKEQRDWSKFNVNKFDPSTLKPFDKILVRDHANEQWKCVLFSYIDAEGKYRSDVSWNHCVPYNDNTKYLVGTTDMEPEYYKIDDYDF